LRGFEFRHQVRPFDGGETLNGRFAGLVLSVVSDRGCGGFDRAISTGASDSGDSEN
jgi:hypothetical protein